MGTAIKHPVPEWVKPVIYNCLHLDTLTLRAERQSAQMSKFTNDRLNPFWHRMLYSCTHMAVGIKGFSSYTSTHI